MVGGSIDNCRLRDQPTAQSGVVFNAIANYSKQPDANSRFGSAPFRVCLCEDEQPLCSASGGRSITAYPGETFYIQAATVGQ